MLRDVARELGVSDPTYTDTSFDESRIEYDAEFKVAMNIDCYVRIKGFGCAWFKSLHDIMKSCPNAWHMECFNLEHCCAKEYAAHDVIHRLEGKHNVVVLDHNWHKTNDIRGRCMHLTELVSESRNMY